MKIALIQFSPWDKIYNFDSNDLDIKKEDMVIVKTEIGLEIGKVIDIVNIKQSSDRSGEQACGQQECINCDKKTKNFVMDDKELKPVLRKATKAELEKADNFEEKKEALKVCRELIKKMELPMKLVDARFSYDGSKITFAFISDGRIDFRALVKELTQYFNKTIRLQQIGIRDEAKIMGEFGHCGRKLCCKKFLNDLVSITSEMAEVQEATHRGSDKISGLCGRLMCCLAYENEGYKEMAKKMPPIGKKVDVDGQKGKVLGHHVLKQTVDVEFQNDGGDDEEKGRVIVEVDLNRHKKNK